MEKYGKILSDYNTIRELMGESFDANKGYYVIEEKVDGSQIRGEILSDGSMMAGSKTVDFTEANPAQKDFRLGQEKMIEALKKVAYLEEHIQLFGEYLRQPRHNSIHYERVPKNNIYLFDAKVNGRWLNEKELIKLANIVELEPVCIINKMDRMPNMEDLQPYLAAGTIKGSNIASDTLSNTEIGLASSSVDVVSTPVSTTSTTTFSNVCSTSFTPKKTGIVKASATIIGNNDTAGDGLLAQLSADATIVSSTSFISSAAKQNQVWSAEYIITGLNTGTAYTFSSQIEALTGGTASAIGTLVVEELLA